jgi:NADPH:quinone reductase-like Zn-dependent oxidoreductase
VTVGSAEKARRCVELGATAAIDYKTEDFPARIHELTKKRGADVILDHIGAQYLAQNLAALATGGRLVEIGVMGGAKSEVNLGLLLTRRLAVIGSTLRGRPTSEKAAIVHGFLARFGAALEAGRIKPMVHTVLPLADAAEAHRLMKSSDHFGKIVLRVA